MSLLGCLIPYGGSLTLLREAAAIGKVAGIVGRDQLGVAIHGNDPLGVLLGRDGLLPGDHAEDGRPLPHAALLIPGSESLEKSSILPALSACFQAKPVDPPADQVLVVYLSDPADSKIPQQSPPLHVTQNGPEHRVGVFGSCPFPQLIHIESKLLLICTREIAHLLAEGMGSRSTGPSGRIFRHGNDNLWLLPVYRARLAKVPFPVQRDLDIRTGNDVADGG